MQTSMIKYAAVFMNLKIWRAIGCSILLFVKWKLYKQFVNVTYVKKIMLLYMSVYVNVEASRINDYKRSSNAENIKVPHMFVYRA